jgi:hypothetical protein
MADDVEPDITHELRAAARQPAVEELGDRLIREERRFGYLVLQEEAELGQRVAFGLLIKLQRDVVIARAHRKYARGLEAAPGLAQLGGLVVAVGGAVERAYAEAGHHVEMQALPHQLRQHPRLPGAERAAAAEKKAYWTF